VSWPRIGGAVAARSRITRSGWGAAAADLVDWGLVFY